MSNTTIRVTIDEETKREAAEVLAGVGLSVSEVTRLLLRRIARDKAMPFETFEPNAETKAAIKELEEGRGKSFASVDDLMAELNADD